MDNFDRYSYDRSFSQPKAFQEKPSKSTAFSNKINLAKQFMYDPSLFNMNDPLEPDRGPGTYDIPSLIGDRKRRQVAVSKSPQRALPPNYSPGVCYYDPNANSVLERSPVFASQNEERFKWQADPKKRHLPLMYEQDINTKLRRHGVF